MRSRVAVGMVVAFGLLLFVSPVFAHHSFTAEFDIYQPVIFTGTVAKVDWINPHSQFYIKDCSGEVQGNWRIESWGTANLRRTGITRDNVTAGTVVKVRGYRAKDGSNLAYLRNLTLPDGRSFEAWVGGANGTPDQQGKF
jgi:hypothetical protein